MMQKNPHYISPKLRKLSANVLSKSLTIAINHSLNKGIFPDNAKIASVLPLHKVIINILWVSFDSLVFYTLFKNL